MEVVVKRRGTDRHQEKEKGGLGKERKSDRETAIQKGLLKIKKKNKTKINESEKANHTNKQTKRTPANNHTSTFLPKNYSRNQSWNKSK